MELVIRAAIIYAFVLVILRVSGKRQFSEITTFDFVLLLIISEAAQQGLYGGWDYSLTASLVLVTTLVAIDIMLSLLKQRFRVLEDVVESKPTLLIQDGRLIEANLAAERIDESDILSSARVNFGTRAFATSGTLSSIARSPSSRAPAAHPSEPRTAKTNAPCCRSPLQAQTPGMRYGASLRDATKERRLGCVASASRPLIRLTET